MTHAARFSDSYMQARARFRAAAAAAGFELRRLPLAGPEAPALADLSIDVAWRDPSGSAAALIVSSGLHGVEGYFGSAVQLAILEDPALIEAAAAHRLVLVHALNPFGMRWGRRWNEDGADLNRNFLPDDAYRGCSDAYARLDPVLNPRTPPTWPDLFALRALGTVAEYGLTTLKNALATGQYAFANGLFYGGAGPARLRPILAGALETWAGGAERVLQFDLHTGLGPFGARRLFLDEQVSEARAEVLRAVFGAEDVVLRRTGAVALPSRGLMRDWIPGRLPGRQVEVITAEFGTYPALRVMGALRAENRAWIWGGRRRAGAWTEARLREAFVPCAPVWRERVVASALDMVHAALSLDRGAGGA